MLTRKLKEFIFKTLLDMYKKNLLNKQNRRRLKQTIIRLVYSNKAVFVAYPNRHIWSNLTIYQTLINTKRSSLRRSHEIEASGCEIIAELALKMIEHDTLCPLLNITKESDRKLPISFVLNVLNNFNKSKEWGILLYHSSFFTQRENDKNSIRSFLFQRAFQHSHLILK